MAPRPASLSATSAPSTISTTLHALVEVLCDHGLSTESMLAEVGISLPEINNPLRRFRLDALTRLWDASQAATGDDTLGLAVGARLQPTSWHALGLALESSAHLEDFCTRLARNFVLVAESGTLSYNRRRERVLLEGSSLVAELPAASEDTLVSFLVPWIRRLSVNRCTPTAVEMMRDTPADDGERHRGRLGLPVSFGGDSLRIWFDAAAARQPWPGASRELALVNEQVVADYLEKMYVRDFPQRVREILDAGPMIARISRDEVATRLHVSPRTLQQRLRNRGTSFREVQEECLRERAIAALEDPTRPIAHVAETLGFSTAGNFDRAFRRWTGQTPRDYRKSRRA